MPRPKLSEEQLKANKKERNTRYYQTIKDDIKQAYQSKRKESVLYLITGLENDKCYIGVSNLFENRKKNHIAVFGNVKIEPIIRFTSVLSVHILNYFESVMIDYYGDRCINKINLSSYTKAHILSLLHHVLPEYHQLILDTIDPSGKSECGLND